MKTRFQMVGLMIAIAVTIATATSTASAQPTLQARVVKPVAVTGDLIDITRANDGDERTRAYSSKPNYVGLSVIVDVGGEQNIIAIAQNHSPWSLHYPARYVVEVGLTAQGPWLTAFEGAGRRGLSRAEFPAIRGRFIRITPTATHTQATDWTISELSIGIDPGQRARIIPRAGGEPDKTPATPKTELTLKDAALANDKNVATRATTGTPDYVGASFTYDLGGEYELSRVVQNHGQWPDDFPAEYKIEVSRRKDETEFREVFRGRGEQGRSVANFNPITTRYIRITALKRRNNLFWWSIAEFRTNRDPDDLVEDDAKRVFRQIVKVSALGLSDMNNAIDDDVNTRAASGKPNYAGSWVILDLGGSYTISNVVQNHNPNNNDYPGRYRVEVSEDNRRWQQVWEGAGEEGRSRANFEPVRARYVRITATAERNRRNWWSISRVSVSN